MRGLAATLALVLTAAPARADADKPLLLQKPTVSHTHVVFAFADDLWIVPRQGGDAQRLTTGAGVETDPAFSPDGKQVAFTGQYEGNTDVYVVPAAGGVPRRLTYHPGPDQAVGWGVAFGLHDEIESVIGRSTEDIESGRALHKTLGDRSTMVTVAAGGHGVYGANRCATDVANKYLATGVLPAHDTGC